MALNNENNSYSSDDGLVNQVANSSNGGGRIFLIILVTGLVFFSLGLSSKFVYDLASAPTPAPSPTPLKVIEGFLKEAPRGDTFELTLGDGTVYEVKIFGFEAPEPGQLYFEEARDELSRLLSGSLIKVEIIDRIEDRRVLSKVSVQGIDVSEEMLRKGFGWCSDSGPGGRDAVAFYCQLQESAKSLSIGLWIQSDPLSPSEFRRLMTGEVADASLVARQVMPSVVMIVAADYFEETFKQGSGFFIAADLVVTNFHIIDQMHSAEVQLLGSKETVRVTNVVHADEATDIAVLRLAKGGGYPVRLSVDEERTGSKIFAIGNPQGFKGTISEGLISGMEPRNVSEGVELIQITAPISGGSSGGPVVNQRGEVVGIATATFSEGQNLNFASPVKYLRALTSNRGQEIPLSNYWGY